MSVEGSEYVVDEANAKWLTAWLNAGRWSRREAKLLFLDIDPDRAHGECFSTFSGHGAVQYEYLGDDASSARMPYGAGEGGELDYLSSKQRALIHKNLELYGLLEKILNLYDSAEPHVWIELACRKGILIPWLDWAIVRVPCIQKQASGAVMNAPIAEGVVSEFRPAASGSPFTMKKAAMIEQHKHEWPTIEQDMKGANRGELNKAKEGGKRLRQWSGHVPMES